MEFRWPIELEKYIESLYDTVRWRQSSVPGVASVDVSRSS